ncbi:MAG: hypothetical protein LBQ10_07185 [Desulfovibrio sp.]|jgi:hypothetical protein|nr:hypothetical protein [Desulfovibrio sp.]
MIAEKINSVVAVLGDLGGHVPSEVWHILSCARKELRDAAEQAKEMEARFSPAQLRDDEGCAHG